MSASREIKRRSCFQHDSKAGNTRQNQNTSGGNMENESRWTLDNPLGSLVLKSEMVQFLFETIGHFRN